MLDPMEAGGHGGAGARERDQGGDEEMVLAGGFAPVALQVAYTFVFSHRFANWLAQIRA